MDSSTSSLSSLLVLPSKLLEDNYKLALKLFVNRNFEKLFAVASQLYGQAVQEYPRGLILETLLVKIISLYIAEITTIAEQEVAFETGVDVDQVISDMEGLFGNRRNVPPEVLYNYYLAAKGKKVLSLLTLEISQILNTFTYNRESSKYEKNLARLYIDLLVEQDRWEDAKLFVALCPVFTTSDLHQLEDWKQVQENQRKQDQLLKQKKELEAKQKKAEQIKQHRDRQLEYVKLNEMRQQGDRPINNRQPTPQDVQLLTQRLYHILDLLKNYFRDNSLVIGVVAVVLAIALRYVKLNRNTLNTVKDRVVDTVKMAMKITYL